MTSFTVKITDPVGLHARPASLIVATASKFKSDIKIQANGKTGNLKSIMNIMSLGVKGDQEITIEASGDDEHEAIKIIKEEMEKNNLI